MIDKYKDSLKNTFKYWWISLVVGLLALVVGIWSIGNPFATIGALTIFLIISLLVSGISDIYFSISNKNILKGWGWTFAIGIISIIFGFILLSRPIESMLVLIALVGFWVMFISITSISGSVEMQRAGFSGWGWLLAFGIMGVILSFLLITKPVFASSFIIAMFSISMILYGIVRIYYAFKLRKINQHIRDKEHTDY